MWARLERSRAYGSREEGLFTTQQAAEAGYSPQLLAHHIRAGRMLRVRRAIYRLVHFPAGRARTTKDIDLRFMGSSKRVLERLQEVARLDLSDFLTFEVGRDNDHPEIHNDGRQYDGMRFRAECQLAGKLYSQHFGVDVAFGDPIFGEPEVVTADDVLGFAGIEPPTLRLYPVETHIAEKLHAYTMPRPRPNSRVKDLPDLALLASIAAFEADRLADALEQTFTFRKTHALPASLPEPNAAWKTPYAAITKSRTR